MKASQLTPINYLTSAVIVVIYVIVQLFQWYVYGAYPALDNTTEAALFQGDNPWHQIASLAMLFSFFALLYPLVVVCIHNFTTSPVASIIAFLGLFIFCLLEIYLLSIELFQMQIQLPAFLMQTNGPDIKVNGIKKYYQFLELRQCLYFPLTFSQLMANIILAVTIKVQPKINILLKCAFGINAAYLIWWITRMVHGLYYAEDFYNGIYSPVTVFVYSLLFVWFMCNRFLNNVSVEPIDSVIK